MVLDTGLVAERRRGMRVPDVRSLTAATVCALTLTACWAATPAPDARPRVAAPGTSPAGSVLAPEQVLAMAEAGIDTAALWRHLRVLAHDSMLGRGPGQRGDSMTVAYLEGEFRRAGLQPAGAHGYLQPVALLRAATSAALAIRTAERTLELAANELIVQATGSGTELLDGAPLVFGGYGIVAPEFAWDDWKSADLHGAVALVLGGEAPALTARSFAGEGTPTYHFLTHRRAEVAAARGAAGVLVIVPAAFLTEPILRWWLQDEYTLPAMPTGAPVPRFSGYIADSAAARIAHAAGSSLEEWHALAQSADFRPVRTAAVLDAQVTTATQPFTSHNVVGKVTGGDPLLRTECVVYLAHWDAYGVGPAVNGDSIYNGATDAAGAVAQLLAMANALQDMPAPRRTMVFVATTAEESGLLGAEAYIADPVCAPQKTVLAVGVDWFIENGRAGEVTSNGIGYTSLDALVADIAARQGRSVGGAFSFIFAGSDHLALMQRGIVGFFGGGVPHATHEWLSHTPADEIDESWDLTGAAQDAHLMLALGVLVANADAPPYWTVDSEFRRAAAAVSARHLPQPPQAGQH
jgi:Zn-dependent M28 family amino/carboxypeptidase